MNLHNSLSYHDILFSLIKYVALSDINYLTVHKVIKFTKMLLYT